MGSCCNCSFIFLLRYLGTDKHSLELTDIIYLIILGKIILKMKSYFSQIYKIIFLLLLSSISNLYAHNLFNGGCKEHCGKKVKVTNNNNKLKNIDDQINIESKNSCLNKSICRG